MSDTASLDDTIGEQQKQLCLRPPKALRQVNVRLAPEGVNLLSELMAFWGMSQAGLVRMMLRHEYSRMLEEKRLRAERLEQRLQAEGLSDVLRPKPHRSLEREYFGEEEPDAIMTPVERRLRFS